MAWYNGSWPYRRAITLPDSDSAGIKGGPHTGFPVPVQISIAEGSGHQHVLDNSRLYCEDWIFTDDDGVTELAYERAFQDPIVSADGIWTWFSNPVAHYYHGTNERLYIAYITKGAKWAANTAVQKIGVYDFDADTFTEYTMAAGVELDDHNNPSVFIIPSGTYAGRILAFYTQHGTLNTPITMQYSTSAEDFSSRTTVTFVAANAARGPTYTQTVFLSGEGAAGRLYTFYRIYNAGVAIYAWYYKTSDDGGATWSAEVRFWNGDAGTNGAGYIRVASNGVDEIHVMAINALPQDFDTDLYAFYRDSGGTWRNYAGTDLGALPFSSATSNLDFLFDGTTDRVWHWDILVDGSGNPHLLFQYNKDDTGELILAYITHNGSSWQSPVDVVSMGYHFIPDTEGAVSVNYAAGGCFAPDDPTTIYAVASTGSPYWVLRKYTTDDSGATWDHVESLTPESGYNRKIIRPRRVHGASPPVDLVYCTGQFREFTEYETRVCVAARLPGTLGAKVSAYVNVDLPSSGDQTIYLYYGNTGSTTENADPAAVWDANYAGGVYHCETVLENADEQALVNSNGTSDVVRPEDIALRPLYADPWDFGQLLRFDGALTSATGDFCAGPSYDFASLTGMTVECVARWDSSSGDDLCTILSNWDAAATDASFFLRVDNGDGTVDGFVRRQTNTTEGGATTGTVSNGVLAYLTMRFTGTAVVVGINGTEESVDTFASAAMDATAAERIDWGRDPRSGTPINWWKGDIGGVRISGVDRGADWIKTTANAYADPSGWFTLGDAEGPFDATAALTLDALTCSASGSHSAGAAFDATAALTLDELTTSVSGSFTLAPVDGAAALTLDALTTSISGAQEGVAFDGTSALTLDALTTSVSGDFTPAPVDGTSALTIDALTTVVVGEQTGVAFDGASALTLTELTTSISGTHTVAPVDGTAALTLEELTCSVIGSGSVIVPNEIGGLRCSYKLTNYLRMRI